MKKAVIITGPGFEDSEFIYPYYRLQEAGYAVDVVTSNDRQVTGKYGIAVVPTKKIKDLDCKDYNLLVVPGGHEAPDRVRQVGEILRFTAAMFNAKKIISSVCHGPWVLVSAGILKGKKATSYKGCKDDLINAGAEYLDQPVVVDGNLVTAQHFRDNPEWMRETLKVVELNKK
ncbi:DJ-1/PfpI/YhbO family deglycase/protease [Candidatus Margulisiibacteriota bacterium]